MMTCRAEHVRRLATQQGFALVGVAPAAPSDHGEYIHQWLGENKHGQMAYLANHLDVRLDPRKLLPGAQSIICVADRYHGTAPPDGPGEHPPPPLPEAQPTPTGRVARYAWGDDYHRVMKKRLFALADALRQQWAGHEYKAAVDTAPILEREHAHRAGLGWVGKHTLLIHPRLGSWLLLGQIVTTLPIEPDKPNDRPTIEPDHCGTCTRCIDACPTDCISPYQLDAQRCISYLTLEHRGPIEPTLHTEMGDWIAGCDVCQEVCPFNQEGRIDTAAGQSDAEYAAPIHPRYTPRPPGPAISLLELLGWDADARQDAFQSSALKRIKLDMLKRNALIAAGNHLAGHDDPPLRARIEQLAQDADEPELVRLTARQVLDRLDQK